MAWSIFSQPNGNLLAEQYAIQALQAIGAPTTPGNIQFMYQWQKSEGGGGKYNPLNMGPVPGADKLTSTGQQYGGGAADYVSWNASLAGFLAYMNMPNFVPVRKALQANNPNQAKMLLWASPWAASHYGNGSAWSNASIPSLDPSATAAAGSAAGMAGTAWQDAQKVWGDLQGGVDPTSALGIAGDYAGAAGTAVAGWTGQLGSLLGDVTSSSFWKRVGVFVLGGALVVGGGVIFFSSTKTGQEVGRTAAMAAVL